MKDRAATDGLGGHQDGRWPRASTGVPGLDEVMRGGFTRGRLYLVEGAPGVGKTTLAFQFLLEGVRNGEKVLFVTLSETEDELQELAASHGWAIEAIPILEVATRSEREDDDTVFHPAEQALSARVEAILNEIRTRDPTRIVVDSCAGLRLLAGNEFVYRGQLKVLRDAALERQAVVLLIDHLSDAPDAGYVHTLVHGVVRLEQLVPSYGATRRQLQLPKLRGTPYHGGYHPYALEEGGLEVYPRFPVDETEEATGAPASSAIPELDALLGGEGLDRGTSTLVSGPAGTGKSVIAMQFAVAAADRGERAAVFHFDESPTSALTRCRKLWPSFEPHRRSGALRLHHEDPAELTMARLFREIRAVVTGGATVIVFDSLNGLLSAVPGEGYLARKLHAMLNYLAARSAVTILVLDQHGFIGGQLESPVDVSYIADTEITLRYFEADGALRRAVSVPKRRTGGHEQTIRELVIDSRGIRVGGALSEFRGILTGNPEYVGRVGPGGPLIPAASGPSQPP